jgi:hypothetical protein
MASFEERKAKGLVEFQIGCEQKDRQRAMAGIDEFLHVSMMQVDLESLMDRAEVEDNFYDMYTYPDDEDN